MILITGIPSEPPVALAIKAAEQENIPYILFNQRHAHFYELEISLHHNRFSAVLNINNRDYDLTQIRGIYVRLMDYGLLPEIKNRIFNYIGQEASQKSIAINKALLDWVEITPSRILNSSWSMMSNFSKPYQAQLITDCGLKTPHTLVTSNWNELRKFKHKKQSLIFKSTSAIRSIVKELDDSFEKNIPFLRFLPVQFQEKLEGTNIRVHVVGDALFATGIISKVTDYRYAGRESESCELTPLDLPEDISNHCFTLSKKLNLPLCGIDLFKTKTGEYYCFEVNPSPGYSYYEQSTGQPISKALVKWLEYGHTK